MNAPGSHTPYEEITKDSSRIKVIGLPSGVTFKKPSQMGKADLKAVLAVRGEIKFSLG